MTDKTKLIVADMLCEDTGRALCDSGGIPQYDENGCYTGSTQGYGRRFEQNRCRDFEAEPEVSLTFRWGYPEVTISLFHYLTTHLEYDEDLDKMFQDFCKTPEYKEETWFTCLYEFPDHLRKLGFRVGGIYGDGEVCVAYTYNEQTLLDQDFQYTLMNLEAPEDYENFEDGCYIMVTSHNGCDARGGFSMPRAFKHAGYDDAEFFHYDRATIHANGTIKAPDQYLLFEPGVTEKDKFGDNRPFWDTDDAYHWYFQGGCGNDSVLDLGDYEQSDDPEDCGKGKIYVDEDGNGYCPLTGTLLEAYAI